MAVRAVRGAVQIKRNDSESIRNGVVRMMQKLTADNEIAETDIISIIFTQTKDLTALNPAAALRTVGYSRSPLFCTQEPVVDNTMPRVIRVLVTTETERKLKPVYLDGAENLRKDLFQDET